MEIRRMKTFITLLLTIIALPLLSACWTPQKTYWDAEVYRLCAIDGGIKVYETVTLPANRFDEYGNVKIKSKKLAKPTDEYYLEFEEVYLKKGSPRLIRFNTQVIRAIDGKVMGESIRYARSGGDFPGPWHETSFDCPPLPMNLSASIFLKGK
jgi:hypothetical protein